MIPRTWSWDPAALAAAGVAVALYAQAFVRLRRRNPRLAGVGNALLFLTGVALGTLAVVSPLDTIAEEYLQSAHMLQHVLIADLGIALTLLAVRGPLSFFFLPRDLLAPLARASWLRATVSFLLRPAVAVSLWLGVLVAWHLPAL